MVVMIAEKLAAVCLETTAPDVVAWLKAKKIEIIPVPFQDTVTLGCNVMSLGKDRVIAPKAQPGPDRGAKGARLHRRGDGHERDLQDRRRHPLHGPGAAPGRGLKS